MSSNHKQNESDDSQNIIKTYNFQQNITEILEESRRSVNQISRENNNLDNLNKQYLIKSQHSKDVQIELALILTLQQKIKHLITKKSFTDNWWEKLKKIIPNNRHIIISELKKINENLELAIESLHESSDNLDFAKVMRFQAQQGFYQYKNFPIGSLSQSFLQLYHSPSKPIRVLLGLISAIFIYGGITGFIIIADRSRPAINFLFKNGYQRESISQKTLRDESSEDTTNLNPKELKSTRFEKHIQYVDEIAIALAGGTLGSIISILIRIEDFRDHKYDDKITPFLIGAVKPIIGGSFGLLFLAFINSKILLNPEVIKFTDDVDQKKSVIFAVAFIVGFSERLAKDTISKAEDILSSSPTTTDSSQQTKVLQEKKANDGSTDITAVSQMTTTKTENIPQPTDK